MKRRAGRCQARLSETSPGKSRSHPGWSGFSLLETVVAATVLALFLMTTHHATTRAWTLRSQVASRSQVILDVWNQAVLFQNAPDIPASELVLEPGLRPARRLILERDGIVWEVLRAR